MSDADTIRKLQGQLQNCVNLLHRLKRHGYGEDAELADDAIEQANRAVYESSQKLFTENAKVTGLVAALEEIRTAEIKGICKTGRPAYFVAIQALVHYKGKL